MRDDTQLTQEERYQIESLLKRGHHQSEIAVVLKCHKSTICSVWMRKLLQRLINRGVSPLRVVPLKIGKNNCKPGETYRKTPSLCETPTLDRANFAEDRHQHSRGGLSVFENAG
jgi:hypothetical protein